MTRRHARLAAAGVGIAACLAGAPAVRPWASAQPPEARRPDVVFVPTPHEVVQAMLDIAEVKADDVVYDLGCGDGRIVVAAARDRGARGVGIDIDPKRVAESRAGVKEAGVEDKVEIRQADIFRSDLSPATVVTMYLLPNLNVRLMPQLRKLKPGTRIVSHSFTMKGARPNKSMRIRTARGGERTVYLWVVPWEEER